MDTGAPAQVARFIQIAAASSAASMAGAACPSASSCAEFTIRRLSVALTRSPARTAPAISATATRARPARSPIAPDPTAGLSELLTSLAPIVSAK